MAVDPDRWMAQGLPKAWARELFDNFGGYIAIDVSNGHTVSVPDEIRYVYHYLTGTLTGNQTYTFPAIGGFYFLWGAYSGAAFNLTVRVVGGSGITLTAGKLTLIFIDAIHLTITQIATGDAGGTTTPANANSNYQIPDTGVGLVRCDASGGGFTVSLPVIANTTQRTFIIYRVTSDATYNDIAINKNAADGGTKIYDFSNQGSINIYNNGSSWDVL